MSSSQERKRKFSEDDLAQDASSVSNDFENSRGPTVHVVAKSFDVINLTNQSDSEGASESEDSSVVFVKESKNKNTSSERQARRDHVKKRKNPSQNCKNAPYQVASCHTSPCGQKLDDYSSESSEDSSTAVVEGSKNGNFSSESNAHSLLSRPTSQIFPLPLSSIQVLPRQMDLVVKDKCRDKRRKNSAPFDTQIYRYVHPDDISDGRTSDEHPLVSTEKPPVNKKSSASSITVTSAPPVCSLLPESAPKILLPSFRRGNQKRKSRLSKSRALARRPTCVFVAKDNNQSKQSEKLPGLTAQNVKFVGTRNVRKILTSCANSSSVRICDSFNNIFVLDPILFSLFSREIHLRWKSSYPCGQMQRVISVRPLRKLKRTVLSRRATDA